MNKKREFTKYLILLIIVILQIFDLSCGPSMFFLTFDGTKNEAKEIGNLAYKDHCLFIEERKISEDKSTITGKLFYTPDYSLLVKTKFNQEQFNTILLTNLIDLGAISLILANQSNTKNANINLGTGLSLAYFFMDFSFGNNAIFEELNNKTEKRIYLMRKNSTSIKYNQIKNMKDFIPEIKKEDTKKELGKSKIFLSKNCNDKNNIYTMKIEKDGSFKMPYNIFLTHKICNLETENEFPYIKIKTNSNLAEIQNHIFSSDL
jgi:hypothetical protein